MKMWMILPLLLATSAQTLAANIESVATSVVKESLSAENWQLSSGEWSRYQELINRPEAYGLIDNNPLVVLGQFARSDKERRQYAERLVELDKKRIDGLLALDNAYRDAWETLYPTLTPIGKSLPDRVSLFVTPNCEPCIDTLKSWRLSGVSVDVFMVNSQNNDAVLRQWASTAGIRQSDVVSQFITLNHDTRGLWFHLAKGQAAPVSITYREGAWSIISLPSS